MTQKAEKAAVARRPRRSSAEIRELILSAATEEFNERGYGGATTAAIAQRADVTEAQLFRSFDSKSRLFREAVFAPLDRHFSEFNARQIADAADAVGHEEMIGRYVHELQQFIGEHAKLFMSHIVARAYASDREDGDERIGSLSSYFDRGAAMMSSRVGSEAAIDPRLMVRTSFAAVLGTILFKDWLFPEGLASEEAIESAMIDFVKFGIHANAFEPGTDR